MKFQFEGQTYVIGFAHDPSRDWAAHEGHALQLVRIISPVSLPSVILFCSECTVQLSHVPKYSRARLTTCWIYQVSSVEGGISKVEIAEGVGRCNKKDLWTREGGRLAALRNALAIGLHVVHVKGWNDESKSAFRKGAWEAYQTRHWNAHTARLQADTAPLEGERMEGGAL